MRRFPNLILIALLTAAPAVTGCEVAPEADDDDAVEPPGADDDDADDDTPRMTFSPSSVRAGEIATIFTTFDNFELTNESMICCASDEVVFFRIVEAINETMYDFRFFFGLHADGTHAWGIEDAGVQVVDEFEIEPLGPIPDLAPGLGVATGVISDEGGFDVFRFEATEANSFVVVRASAVAPEDFHPWLWVLAEDGRTGLAARGFDMGGVYEEPWVALYAEEPGTYYLRVQDNDEEGGEDYTFTLDMMETPAGDSMLHDEVEPNDEAAEWQDLGVFGGGLHEISGVAATAGHDADNDLNGDLDVFRFSLEEEAYVQFQLDWDTDDDLDALLYDASDGDPALGFGSADAISFRMASTQNPERTALALPAGREFVVQMGNWQGEPDAPWTLTMRVIPVTFEGDGR